MQQKDTHSISSNLLISCGNCKINPLVNAPPFMRCGLCKQISYCCKECQTVDRPRHKVACTAERVKQTNPAPSLETVRNISSSDMLSEEDNLKYIEKLISTRSDLNSKQLVDDENTLLLVASDYGYVKCVNLLLQLGANPNIANKDNIKPLFIACENGHDVCVSVLLQHGADPSIANKDNETPLQITCHKGHDVCVSALLQHGADPNIAAKDNATPLYIACQNGHQIHVSIEETESRVD